MSDALLFVDTNILLDFYRVQGDTGLHPLIEQHASRIITTYQVEMEFRKHRQREIVKSLAGVTRQNQNLQAPAFLRDDPAFAEFNRLGEQAATIVESFKARIRQLLNPTSADPVLVAVNKLFRTASPIRLVRDSADDLIVRRFARKRFAQGFPPRKSDDTSFGDGINWEWIVKCAVSQNRDVVIASRDSDYGLVEGRNAHINDWLLHEFETRVGGGRRLTLANGLSGGLNAIGVDVSKKQSEAEQWIVEQTDMIRGDVLGTLGGLNSLLGHKIELAKLCEQLGIETAVIRWPKQKLPPMPRPPGGTLPPK